MANIPLAQDTVAKKIIKDFSDRYITKQNSDAQKIADSVTPRVRAIEKMMARECAIPLLKYLSNAKSLWLPVYEERRITPPVNKDDITSRATLPNLGAGPFQLRGISDSGRYGTWFENIFFEGGAGNESIPDVSRKRFVKGKIVIDYTEVKTGTITRLGGWLKEEITGAKKGTMRDQLTTLFNEEKFDEYTRLIQLKTLETYLAKLPNFLLAGIAKRPSEVKKQKEAWIITSDVNWERLNNPKFDFFVAFLYYYFDIILDNLISLIEKYVYVTKEHMVSKMGLFTSEFPNKERQKMGDIKVSIRGSLLPKADSEILENIMNNPDTIYAGVKPLFDIKNGEDSIRKYYENLIKRYGNESRVRLMKHSSKYRKSGH